MRQKKREGKFKHQEAVVVPGRKKKGKGEGGRSRLYYFNRSRGKKEGKRGR